jgi:hypothetical protein
MQGGKRWGLLPSWPPEAGEGVTTVLIHHGMKSWVPLRRWFVTHDGDRVEDEHRQSTW